MLMLMQREDWSQVRLGKAVGIQVNRMVDLVDSLEFKGYVKREQNAEDRREYRLRITDFGKKACAEIEETLKTKKPPYLRELGVAELHYLNAMLSRIIGFKVGGVARRYKIGDDSYNEMTESENQTEQLI